MLFGADTERAGRVQHEVAAQVVAGLRSRRAVIPAAVVMHGTVVVLVAMRRVDGSLFMTLDERGRDGDALQRHHEDGHSEKQLPNPRLRHVSTLRQNANDYRRTPAR
ncbi:MAG TPA: hypothetical protein VED01_24630 [Burkholderiales bacterium]|nr:hypothetical protein [Burkholderiales bacterium]